MSTQVAVQIDTLVNAPVEKLVPNFGAGRYSPLMKSVFEQSQVIFKLTPEQAEKLARQVAADFGAGMKNVQAEAKIGKSINKDGQVTLSDASKVKGITCTNALFAMQSLAWCMEAGKHGFQWSGTQWALSVNSDKSLPPFTKYLSEL
jgi:hypothetical protein